MSYDYKTVNVTETELNRLKEAAEMRFGDDSRISRSAMVRLMADETIARYEGQE